MSFSTRDIESEQSEPTGCSHKTNNEDCISKQILTKLTAQVVVELKQNNQLKIFA